MKAILLFSFVIYFANLPNKCFSSTICSFPDSLRVCKIIEIQKAKKRINNTNKAYIILIQDTLSKRCLTIVSLKSDSISVIKIKKGNTYTFYLEKYFNIDYIIAIGVKQSIRLNGILINIPFGPYTSNIYTTKNLKGLFYFP